MFALVKWVNGDDDGKLSVIPTEWIKGFNIEDFEEEGGEDERHYVAEWRRGSKPRGGWQAFDCEVEKVGERQLELVQMRDAMTRAEETPALKRKKFQNSRYADESSSDTKDTQVCQNSKTKASAKQQRSTEILNQLTKKPQTNKEDGEVQQLKSKIQELEQENKKLKETVVGAIPVILDKIEELGKRDNSGPTDHSIDSEANCLCGSPRYAASSAGSTVSISSIPQSQGNGRQLDKVEIHPGSGVYIDQLAWTITNKATSYTSFVRNAMLSVFDIETLVKSNLRGGSGKRQKHGERREALDPNKVNAIYAATLMKFPLATKSQIGSVINGKIAELRYAIKKNAHKNTQGFNDTN
ncbi:hypothetical protein HHUSO_G36819 [Huso huso]|uniref:BEN domain-containing protein n=1 Tax=Huso huso TaxID=61971 RepID=A0ABR0Y130_HUSHU